LTSEPVTNWTLSDRLRRVDLKVAVVYAADPERVLDILRTVARAHPKALADPAPLALCTGFADSALNFELRVWTARFEERLGLEPAGGGRACRPHRGQDRDCVPAA